MATLAEQLESALEGTGSAMSASNIEDMLSGTATSITPGTVTPISPQQSNQLSWNQVFSKIGEGVALKPGEGLPEVPKNIPASTFYRTATQAGKLPSGGAQFFTKPLAPETKPWKLTDTPTTTTPATTSATTSQQNIVRQMREAVDLSPQDSTMGDSDLQRSFEEGTGFAKQKGFDWDDRSTYGRIEKGPTTLAAHDELLSEALARAHDAYDKGDPRPLQQLGFSPDVAAMKERAQARKDFAGEVVTFKDVQEGRKNIADYTKYRALSKVFDVTQIPKNIMAEPGKEIPKTALGFYASMKLGPASMMVKPLLDAMFSEGGGQIGTTGIVSDDYWNGETFGTTTFSAVHGFADIGKGLSVAVDKDGNILGTASGINKGVTMYGIATKAGQAAWDAKQARDARKKPSTVELHSKGIDYSQTAEDYAAAVTEHQQSVAQANIQAGGDEGAGPGSPGGADVGSEGAGQDALGGIT